MQSYPDMNARLVGILRSGNAPSQYAAQRIVELEVEIERLRAALADCMQYVDCDNLTQQIKHRNWQAVLDGKPWNPANVEVSR